MATLSGIFSPTAETFNSTIAATTSSAEIVIGAGKIFAFNATGDVNIKWGNSGMSAADATAYRIPGGVTAEYDMGIGNDRVRIYNPGGAQITYWIQCLTKV